ncbi:restriction endonuclease subunit S [Pseudoalteromonas sp. 2CM36K]|uniref:restriction endonuclease subunit S n=1 Tax=Pseudoalteromonas sp. 2CM36K TaxID=2929854 RepID=UPI0020C082B8|nr:restriction endonuclease subunit S [Pseudoalteromonas sp. 2CM36K]MCK8102391.1 restriction endonuclease subunit S [Pseudoalteromonas sp. 2CM36K]
MTGRYKSYPEYKKSGIEWVGDIPSTWEVKPTFSVFDPSTVKNVDGKEAVVLSLSYGNIIKRDVEKNFGLLPESFNTYQIVNDGDLILRLTDLQNDKKSLRVGQAKQRGIITSAYLKLRSTDIIEPSFAYRLLHSYDTTKVFYGMGGGLRQSMKFEDFRRLPIVLPSIKEQQKIASFLDHETAKIDTLIAKQEKLIELLKEKRQAVISHAVTKGLNPNAPMKDSGVEWLGEVPEHWEIIFIKHLSQVKRGASPRPIDDPKYFDDNGEYSWTRIADVSSSGMYLTETTQRLSALGSSLSVRLEAGELFLSIAGTVGKPCITTSKACIHDGFVYFPQLRINNKYLYYIFDAGQAYLGLGKMGTQLNLNTDTVGGIKIGLPPENEIEEIISYIEKKNTQYSDLISKAACSIDLMKERKIALISAAVTGKIDVRDWESQGV